MNFSPYIVPEDGLDGMLEKVFSANVKALHDTLEWVDREMIARLVDALETAETVWIYGVGSSAALSSEFWYRMMQVGKNAHCLTDVLHMKMSEMNIKKGDVAIGISHSGRTACVVEALEHARGKGAVTACITGHSDSPLTQNSDFPIAIIAEEIKYPIYAISSRIAHISVMDVISIAVSARRYEEMQGRNQKLKAMEEALY
jgi:DNA-binding MurR/RpiR family transcriptional regulator